MTDLRTIEVKACPFCGEVPRLDRHVGGSDERNGYNFVAQISCSCGAQISRESHQDGLGWCDDKGQALAAVVEAWNRRTTSRERRDASTTRPVVAWFSGVMEERLRANDHKGGWSHCSQRFLLARIFEEIFELEAAIENGAIPADIESEAADVANFAMMLADVCGGAGRRHKD